MEIVVAIFSFLLGAASDRMVVNKDWDTARCDKVRDQIDDIVGHFHERFSPDPVERRSASRLFDYQIRSLVDDTTLLPIIGRAAFDGPYVTLIGDIFALSQGDPESVPDSDRQALLRRVEKKAVDLKKVISSNEKAWRLFQRN